MILAVAEPTDDLDSGPRARPGTERMCAVSRQVRPVDQLIRFVVTPSGEVAADLKRKLPGRGLWVGASHATLDEAVKRGVFAKGFKRAVKVSPTLADDTEALLVRGVAEALAIVAKAGDVVSGFAKVENALKQDQITALIHASDGAADGIRKLNSLAEAIARAKTGENAGESSDALPVIQSLTSAQLDLALGRSNVIHAAVLAGPAGKTFLSRARGLVQFQAWAPGETAKTRSNTKARAKAPGREHRDF